MANTTFRRNKTLPDESAKSDFHDLIDTATLEAVNITNADIDPNAAIADSKLAQITTAGKVSGAALTSLSSIPSAAGVIPAANLPVTATIPSGLICMWSGSIATMPTGWVLCNGSNSTPDLRDKFIVGAAQDSGGVAKSNITGSLAQTGGATTLAHTHTGTTSALGGSAIRIDDNSGGSDYDWQNPTSHTHTFTSDSSTGSIIPTFYALAYIMKS